MRKVGLGSLVRDKITGFEGIVMGRTEYLTGCAHVGIHPRGLTNEGSIPGWEWIDETRVIVLERDVVRLEPRQALGGPAPNPPSM